MWHGYFGIENLNLNPTQREMLVQALRQLGPGSDPQPARLCHWRTRLDGQAAIFEANFQDSDLTVTRWKQRLGAIFGVSPVTIGSSTVTQHFAGGDTPVVTFSRTGTDYLRVALFGGVAANWAESRAECVGYLANNLDEWQEPEA